MRSPAAAAADDDDADARRFPFPFSRNPHTHALTAAKLTHTSYTLTRARAAVWQALPLLLRFLRVADCVQGGRPLLHEYKSFTSSVQSGFPRRGVGHSWVGGLLR